GGDTEFLRLGHGQQRPLSARSRPMAAIPYERCYGVDGKSGRLIEACCIPGSPPGTLFLFSSLGIPSDASGWYRFRRMHGYASAFYCGKLWILRIGAIRQPVPAIEGGGRKVYHGRGSGPGVLKAIDEDRWINTQVICHPSQTGDA